MSNHHVHSPSCGHYQDDRELTAISQLIDYLRSTAKQLKENEQYLKWFNDSADWVEANFKKRVK